MGKVNPVELLLRGWRTPDSSRRRLLLLLLLARLSREEGPEDCLCEKGTTPLGEEVSVSLEEM